MDEHDPDEPQAAEEPEAVRRFDRLSRLNSKIQRQMLRVIVEVDTGDLWDDGSAQDICHWVGMRLGISYWKAERWVSAAHALQELPRLSEALSSGELSIDKVVELTRFARPETERSSSAGPRPSR